MPHVTRRTFLKGATAGATAGLSTTPLLRAGDAAAAESGALVVGPEEQVEIRFQVNGEPVELTVLPDTTLAHVLRERLGLTGTKTVCEGGACGACTVHIGGKPQTSCLTLAIDAARTEVRTVEGLAAADAKADALHPVQKAFIEADALQCGFCTPGFVMAGVAFFDRWRAAQGNTRPPRVEVERALSGNLCRCGAQPHLIEAVQSACEGKKAKSPGGNNPPWVVSRFDALEKVTGRAKYTVDQYPEGVLHAVVVRSPHAAAKVNSIDVGPAKAMPGVRAAIVLKPQVGSSYGQVRYAGQELAAVAADTLAQAEAAARAVAVDFTVLPHVVDWREAVKDGAPRVWEDPGNAAVPNAAEGFAMPSMFLPWAGNERGPAYWPIHRDNEGARKMAANSAVSTSLQAETANQAHVTMEPHVAVAKWEGDQLTVWTSHQAVQALASDLAEALGVPKTKVRVLAEYVGGGFGSKGTIRPEHLAASKLAREAGRPVRLVLPFEDHIVVGGNRPGTQHYISVGADEDGKLRAIAHEARSFCGVAVGERATGMTQRHYQVDEMNLVDKSVVTHAAPSCPLRAPGFPPNAFALEQAVDDIAAKLEMNPLELRIQQEDRRRVRMLYRAALERSGAADRMTDVGRDTGRYVRGVGVATSEWFGVSAPDNRVELRAYRDGHVEISTATHDLGQGARSVLANVVAERLRLTPDRIVVRIGDSQLSTAVGTFGSLTTPTVAPAAMKAADELRDILVRNAGKKVPGGTAVETGVRASDGTVTTWAELFEVLPEEPTITVGKRGGDLDGYAVPPKLFEPVVPYMPFAVTKDEPATVHVHEVEVDRRLGRIRVVRSFVAVDAGRIASPVTATSQVVGAVMQGASYALYEGIRMDRVSGRQLNRTFESYPILGVADAPDVDVYFYAAPSENNPYGAIGLGENAIVAAAGGIANAVYRALGKRVTSTPMSPARVLAALAH